MQPFGFSLDTYNLVESQAAVKQIGKQQEQSFWCTGANSKGYKVMQLQKM